MSSDIAKISMRGFAEVASAKPARKQSTLKRFKSPKSGESKGRSNYYVKALSIIKKHHRGDAVSVESSLEKLKVAAATELDARARTKLLSNYRAVTDYIKNFGARNLVVKPGKFLYYTFKNLVVSAQPDLVAEEDGSLVLIKLNLSKQDFPGGVSALMLHLLFEAAANKGLPVKPTKVECLQTSSGSRTIGPKSGFPDPNALNAACQEILALWTAA